MSDPANDFGETFGNVIDAATRFCQRVGGGTAEVVGAVDPFVKQRPYAALALAGAVGMFIGLLMAESRPRVIYIKPRD